MKSILIKLIAVSALCMAFTACSAGAGNSDTPASSTNTAGGFTDNNTSDSSVAGGDSSAAGEDGSHNNDNSDISLNTEQHYSGSIDEIMSSMSLRDKVCQMFIVTPEQLVNANGNEFNTVTAAGETTKKSVEAFPVSGIIYFSRNVVDREQLIEMNSNLQAYSEHGMFIAVDEEGGDISRLASNGVEGVTELENMSWYGSQDNAEELASNVGDTLGSQLKELGFNVDFAPVADVYLDSENTMDERCFSDDPELTSALVSAEVSAMQKNGVCATLKHFPGLGATTTDTHYGTAVLDRDIETLRSAEFIPFNGGIKAGAEFIMVSHAVATGLGETEPSDLSYEVVTNVLRKELGFCGIAITDAQTGMASITDNYTPEEASVASIKAGIDIVLMPDDLNKAIEAVIEACEEDETLVNSINDSVYRILTVKQKYGILK